MTSKVKGKDAEKLIYEQVNAHSGGINNALASLDAESVFMTWFETFRAIEEFINLPAFCLENDELERTIVNYRIDVLDPLELSLIKKGLLEELHSEVVERFIKTIIQSSAIGRAFYQHGFTEAAVGLHTVGHAIGYFQSRRRHLLALLYSMPTSCCGIGTIDPNDTLNIFLPHIEHSGLTLTGLYQQIMLAKVFDDFALEVGDSGFSANYHYQPLDSLFLEPERTNVMELNNNLDGSIHERLKPVDPNLVFSVEELLNNIMLIEHAYDEFSLLDTSFATMAAFVKECVNHCEDNYYIKLEKLIFEEIAEAVKLAPTIKKKLTHRGGDYVANLNVYSPFIEIDGIYISSVTLLSRFLYHWRGVCLNRSRRYQIRSGFILENSVKDELAKQGFKVTDIKRINRKEFDVVALLDNVIYNLQCKNNLIDLNKIETDPVRFVRYNTSLDRYYAKALAKEEDRENILKECLGCTEIRHFVVSRFPVATNNPRVFPFSRINRFRELVLGSDV